jgi:hypothetical protein
LRQQQVAAQWFKHMLPLPDGMGLRMTIGSFRPMARRISGISRSSAQPPVDHVAGATQEDLGGMRVRLL